MASISILIADSNRRIIVTMARLFRGLADIGFNATKLWRSFGNCHWSWHSKYGHCHLCIAICTAATRSWSNHSCKLNTIFAFRIFSLDKIQLIHFFAFLDASFCSNIHSFPTDSILHLSHVPWMVSWYHKNIKPRMI